MMLGVGLAVNNTVGVLQALFYRRQGEFVRTPKLGALAEGAASAVPAPTRSTPAPVVRGMDGYQIRLNTVFLVEAMMGAVALMAAGDGRC